MIVFTYKKLIPINIRKKSGRGDHLKSSFLANMSHEIRTMNGILGFTALLKEPKLTGDEQQQYISVIEKSGNRMLNIINISLVFQK
jgi:signal transduction histidine kinase